MTLESYECFGGDNEAKGQSCLEIADSLGVGKTHLAVIIAQYAIRKGRQTYFRYVGSLID